MLFGFTFVHKSNMKNLVWVLVLLVGTLKAQQPMTPMYPQDRVLSCFTAVCATGITYPFVYNAMTTVANTRQAHLYTVLIDAGVGIAVSALSYSFGPGGVNARQNVTASLVSSAVTISLVRIGIGNNIR